MDILSYTRQKKHVADGVARVVGKMLAGQNVKFTFIGDSILEGNTVTTPGTDDAASLICSTLSTRYGVTVTKSNRAVSGRTVATSQTDGHFTNALNDKADCYVIAFAKNDIASDISTPGTGYPKAASIAGLEYMIRRIRREIPFADIILMSENPNSPGNSANSYIQAYSKEMRTLATLYNCQWIDGYKAFTENGDWSTLLSDSVHPNSAGHRLLADAILMVFPTTLRTVGNPPSIPEKSYYGSERYTYAGWKTISAHGRSAVQDGFLVSGSWGTSSPYVSSAAGDSITAIFSGSEAQLRLDCGAGTGVVSISINGIEVYPNLDLKTQPTGQRRIPLTGLGPGIHYVKVKVVSGTITWRGFDYLQAAVEYINQDAGRITWSGTWATGTLATMYGGNERFTNTANSTATFDFIGTAIGLSCLINGATAVTTINVNVDGVNLGNLSVSPGITANDFGNVLLASGLEYGRHTLIMTVVQATAASLQIGGFYTFDETRSARPRVQRGIAMSGEVIKYPISFTATPFVKVSGNGVYSTSESKSGLILSGTASQLGVWEADGNLIAY